MLVAAAPAASSVCVNKLSSTGPAIFLPCTSRTLVQETGTCRVHIFCRFGVKPICYKDRASYMCRTFPTLIQAAASHQVCRIAAETLAAAAACRPAHLQFCCCSQLRAVAQALAALSILGCASPRSYAAVSAVSICCFPDDQIYHRSIPACRHPAESSSPPSLLGSSPWIRSR
jgi:hypothetical protein